MSKQEMISLMMHARQCPECSRIIEQAYKKVREHMNKRGS